MTDYHFFQEAMDEAELKLEEHVENDVRNQLLKRNATVSVSEGFTGGWVSHRFHEMFESETMFLGGLVCNNTLMKVTVGGVQPKTVSAKGEVSQQTSIEMANHVQKMTKSTVSVSNVGKIDPVVDGKIGEFEGEVMVCFNVDQAQRVKHLTLKGRPSDIRYQCVQSTFVLLKQYLMNEN